MSANLTYTSPAAAAGQLQSPAAASTSGPSVHSPLLHWDPQRRVRHITALQVRNLTPFPGRDSLASALNQPSQQPQFTSHGHLSDDLDLTLGRKRARRISSSSITTMRSIRLDSERVEKARPLDLSSRAKAQSKPAVSSEPVPQLSSSPALKRKSSAGMSTSTPSLRRPRTISVASSRSVLSNTSADVEAPSTTPVVADFLRDASQSGLAKVLQARLVETFLAISLPSSTAVANGIPQVSTTTLSDATAVDTANHQRRPTNTDKVTPRKRDSTSRVRGTVASRPSQGTPPKSAPIHTPVSGRGPSQSSSPNASPRARPSAGHAASRSFSVRSSFSPSERPTSRRSASTIDAGALAQPSPSSSSEKDATQRRPQSCPDYLSPIHRPSTNPRFYVDPKGGDFASDADLRGSHLRIELWGRLGPRGKGHDPWKGERARTWPDSGKGKGKAKEVEERPDHTNEDDGWKVLVGWDIDLDELIPLCDDPDAPPSHLPSNTLLVTLSPPNRTFYLPQPESSHMSALLNPSRSSSPTAGYNSDPESEVRKFRAADSTPAIAHDGIAPPPFPHHDAQVIPAEPRISQSRQSKRIGETKTAGWQDLLKLVTLQACIIDTERSLAGVVSDITKFVDRSATGIRNREASERQARLNELDEEKRAVQQRSEDLQRQLRARKERLAERRAALALALDEHVMDTWEDARREAEITRQREHLAALQDRLPPLRSALLGDLASIFPIEPLSPADLLFTILNVPLPIPLSATDPGPPLSLVGHNDVTEDAVATALGYVAQVVHSLAIYMGKSLVYPVTCVGSRSLIKDGISAMVGPRMFPLFSRGVDTYRFEYGVFLLNKDIEMLMSERNLKALDMRHTLPNLKNLLLTLTDPERFPTPIVRPPVAASASASSTQTLDSAASSLPSEGTSTAVAGSSEDAPIVEVYTPPASGSTTPTRSTQITPAATPVARKSRFLDLAPLSGFLRVRYPSSSRSSGKAESSHAEDTVAPTVDAASVESSCESRGDQTDQDDPETVDMVPGDGVESKCSESTLAEADPGPAENEGVAAEKMAPEAAHSPQLVDGVS